MITKHMQVIRIGALILFLLSPFASVDLGFNYVKATVPALNDGIGSFGLLHGLYF